MARKIDSLPRQIQKQIADSGLDLGKIRKTHPQGFFASEPDQSVDPNSDNIVWRRHYFNGIMGRCVNYNPSISGFERGVSHGWCEISTSDQITDAAVAGAKINWLRAGGCSDGTFTTCSGFQWNKHYTPHYKTFRNTAFDISIDNVVSDHGKYNIAAVPSGMAYMYTADILKTLGGNVRLNFKTPNSIAVFVSGHLKYSSKHHSNSLSYVDVSLFPNTFARLNVTYYSPENNGFINFGDLLGSQIDGWRTPPVPSGVQAHYSTFSRRENGNLARWSYILATITPPNNQSVKYVDIDYRAPSIHPQWKRVTLPVDQALPSTTISGLFRVPFTTQILCRARAVDEFGDVGLWHTVSGIVSAAGNIKPGLSPDGVPIRKFSIEPSLSRFEFEVIASQEEEWRDFILISGHQNDHYTMQGIFSATQSAGAKSFEAFPIPTLISSGQLISIGGGYSTDTSGELHLVERVDGSTIYLREPLTQTIPITTIFKAYQIAKISAENKFSLFNNDTLTKYFNIAGRNYGGGISYLASGITSWPRSAVSVTISGALFEDGGAALGQNVIRNGSFELPRYRLVDESFYTGGVPTANPYGTSFSQDPYPFNYWYTVSGYCANVGLGDSRTGRQRLVFGLVDPSQPATKAGLHAAIWQDIVGLSWNGTYFFKAHIAQTNFSSIPYKISGVIGMYYEVWQKSTADLVSLHYRYGEMPPGAEFLHSGSSVFSIKTDSSEAGVYTKIGKQIAIGPSSAPGNESFVRLAIYFAGENFEQHRNNSIAPSWIGTQEIAVDDVSFSRLDRQEHQYDEDIDGRRFNFGAIRLNEQVNTSQGESLNIDYKYGLGVVRRRGNAKAVNKFAPSSIDNYVLSGHMDLPRLVMWAPNVPSLYGSPTHFLTDAQSTLISPTGLLIVPSGRAMMFEIKPKRSFDYLSEIEIKGGGTFSIGNIIPSGSHPYTGVYYDPGIHSVIQCTDIIYDIVGGASSLRESTAPMAARWGDLPVKNVQLYCFTAIGSNTINSSPNISAVVCWHTADVKVYDIAIPFVASGINVAGGNKIGYMSKAGLINIDQYIDFGGTSSIFRGA